MAIIQSVSNAVGPVGSIAPSLTGVVAGSTLALLLSQSNSGSGVASPAPPTDTSGQTWLKAVGANSNGSGVFCAAPIYYLLNANAGTHTLSLSLENSSQFASYTMVEFPACSALDVVTTNSGNTAVTSGDTGTTATTTQADAAVLVCLATNDSVGIANANFSVAATGYTRIDAEQATNTWIGAEHSYKEVSSTGTQIGSWTWDAGAQDVWAASIAVFKLSAGVTLDQEGFRFGNDDAAEASHTWAAAQDANITAPAGSPLLLAFNINATGSPGAKVFKLQYRKVGAPDWSDMPLE